MLPTVTQTEGTEKWAQGKGWTSGEHSSGSGKGEDCRWVPGRRRAEQRFSWGQNMGPSPSLVREGALGRDGQSPA